MCSQELCFRELPYTEIIVGTGDRIEGENLVEFRLLYSGRLLGAKKNDTRASEKHAIRREFHPQLRRLWSSKFMLRRMARQLGPNWIHDHFPNMQEFYNSRKGMSEDEERVELEQFGLNHLGEKWQRCGYKFIPLVTEDLFLRCSLDFLVLRPEEPRLIMQSGDLDAKIKTVFDALRLPSNLAETGGTGPQEDETPFYCLLEDDKLISEIRVTSDELLLLPKERAVNAHDVFLVIHVRLQPFQPTFFSNVFD